MYRFPAHQDQTKKMAAIIKGANNKTVIAIRYQDKSLEVTERTVEPYEVKNGKLFAYCLQKQGIRAFDLNNILAVKGSRQLYEPRYPVKMNTFALLQATQPS